MDRTYPDYANHYRSDSPDQAVCYRPQNQPSVDFSDPCSLLQAFQNNPNSQDPQCLNKIIIPLLLQLLQNQQSCQHCSKVNHQAPSSDRLQSRHQGSFHDGLQPSYLDRRPSYDVMRPSHHRRPPSYQDADPPIQEVYCVPPGRYRSNEYILDQSPPSIQCSDEEIRHACCDSRPEHCDPMRRRNLIPSHYHHYDQLQIARTRSPSPDRRIVERCYWCRQQLYRFYDPDLNKRVFTHFPCHRGAILAPAGKSSYGSIRQMSLVDMSPFNPDRDMMLPCPYLCAKTETTYNSDYRHPEVVAKESVCRVMPKKSQPWEQTSSGVPMGQSSLESIGRWGKPELPRPREERVMFVKPNCCPDQVRMGSTLLDLGDNRRNRSPGPRVTQDCCPDQGRMDSTSLDLGYNRRSRSRGPCVTFSPSTDAYQRKRSIEKDKRKGKVLYYNCRPPQKSEAGGYDLYCKPDPQHGPQGRSSRSSMGKEKVLRYNCSSAQRGEDGGYDLHCKPDSPHRPHRSGRSSRSSSAGSSLSRSRHSHHSHHSRGNMSDRSRHRSRSRTGHRRSTSGNLVCSSPSHRQRRHSAPFKSRSRRLRSRRPRAKSDHGMIRSPWRGRRHRSHSSRRRRRHPCSRNFMSDPAIGCQDSCKEVAVCCPTPQGSVYNASYGNPAEHPYYEGPPNPYFRRQRIEMN